MSDKTPTPHENTGTDPESDPFDPQRFAKISFTTNFFRRLITTRLPEPKAEDLVDSIPPGEGPDGEEVRQAAALLAANASCGPSRLDRGADRRTTPDLTQEKSFYLSPDEARALGGERKKLRQLLPWFGLCLLGGALVSVLLFVEGQHPHGSDGQQRSEPKTEESLDQAAPNDAPAHRAARAVEQESIERATIEQAVVSAATRAVDLAPDRGLDEKADPPASRASAPTDAPESMLDIAGSFNPRVDSSDAIHPVPNEATGRTSTRKAGAPSSSSPARAGRETTVPAKSVRAAPAPQSSGASPFEPK